MAGMRIYTRKGDSGTTGLLFGGDRVSKADLRTDAYGTTDEAVSALGLARASIGSATDRTEARLDELIIRLQRELFVVGAELATHADRRDRLTDGVSRVTAEMVTALEGEIDSLEELVEQPTRVRHPRRVDDRRRARPRSNDRATRRAPGGRARRCRGAARFPRAAVPESAGRPAVRRRARRGWRVPNRPELTPAAWLWNPERRRVESAGSVARIGRGHASPDAEDQP